MYVRVTGDDYARLGELAEGATTFLGNRCYMRMLDEHCANLTVDATGHYSCAIYALRPDVCRTLEEGSASCDAERERKGQLALIVVERLVRSNVPSSAL